MEWYSKKKIVYRSNHRGIKELDLLLGNFVRKYIWKLALKKIHLVTCPTINTMNYIKSLNIVNPDKLKVLYDPILNIREISIKIKKYEFSKRWKFRKCNCCKR